MELTVKKKVEQTLTIDLPIFWKSKIASINEYLGVIDENNAIQLFDNGKYKSISHTEVWVKEESIILAFSEWEIITEEQFLEAHETFIKSLSLTPKLVTI